MDEEKQLKMQVIQELLESSSDNVKTSDLEGLFEGVIGAVDSFAQVVEKKSEENAKALERLGRGIQSELAEHESQMSDLVKQVESSISAVNKTASDIQKELTLAQKLVDEMPDYTGLDKKLTSIQSRVFKIEKAPKDNFSGQIKKLEESIKSLPKPVGGSPRTVKIFNNGTEVSSNALEINFVNPSGITTEGVTGRRVNITTSGGAVDSVNGATGVVVLDADDISDTTTTNKFTTAGDISKLAGIEALADVTDATNVAAAGAVMEGDTTTAAMQFVIDEDTMASNLATKVPTQQSVKAYVDTQIAGVGGLSDGDKGDITVSASGATWTVDNDAITYAKMQNVSATSRVLGRKTALAGDVEELTAADVKTILALTADDIDDTSTTNKFVTAADITKLGNLSGTNTGDQTSIVGITGTTAQFNTALSDGDFATLAGTETLTNKTIDADSNTISNIEVADMKATAVVTSTEGLASSDNDTSLPTTAAVIDYVAANAGGGASFSTTQVYSAAPPTTYTDLDLSSVIGVNQKVVLLKIRKSGAGTSTQTFAFRRNGDTTDANFASTTETGGCNSTGVIRDGSAAYVTVSTDTSGVVEWRGSSSTDTTIITVEAYW